MWQIIKAELKYYRIVFTAPIFFIILFQIMEFFILKTISEMDNSLAYPGNSAGYSFFILFSFFSILQRRIKEKRYRLFAMLPLTNQQIALSRFWIAVIPITIFLFYFFAIHLIVISVWHIVISVPLLQLGVIFILFVSFIRVRDDWFSHWNFIKRIQAAFVSVLIILSIVVAIFLNPPDEYRRSIPIIVDYAEIVFFLLGLIIMVTTIFSYQKRKSYLS